MAHPPAHLDPSPATGRSPMRRGLVPLLAVAFIAASAIAVLLFDTTRTDLDVFFWPSAEIAAHGHPLLVYTLRAGRYPNANGPVSLLPLTLVAAVANAFGWQHGLEPRDALTVGAFAVFSLLLAHEAVLAVEAGRGGNTWRLPVAAVFLLAPPLWVALVGFGHIEQPLELWLILLGVRLLGRGAPLRAGVCLGLAVMTRSVAAVCLLPLVLALLVDRRWARAVALVAAAAVTAGVVIAPFWLADRSDVVYSLLTYRGGLPTVGGSLWVAYTGASWAGFVQHADALLFAGAALVLSAAVLAARPHRGWTVPRVYGLLAVAAACVPMLAKTSWPYYLLDPYVFAAIWWLGRPGRPLSWRLSAPLLLAAGGIVLAAVETTLPLAPGPGAVDGILASAGMALVIALLVAGNLAPGVATPPGPGPA
ncbi:MAG: hypothetical protein WB802_02705 [Candidatus Dormiibacterota bacterium]